MADSKYDEFRQYGIDPDVLCTVRFYMMLSIFLCANGTPEKEATESWSKFIEEGEDWHGNNTHLKNYYNSKAYQSLPSGFLNLMDVPRGSGQQDIRIIDNNMRKWL